MSKPLPTLTHMPWHIKEGIINFADAKTKYRLRSSSEEFKALVGKSKISYKSFELLINIDKRESRMRFETEEGQRTELKFHDQTRGRTILSSDPNVYTVQKWVRPFFEIPIEHFENILKSSKTFLKKFTLNFQCARTEHQNIEYEAIKRQVCHRFQVLFHNSVAIKVEHFHMHFNGTQDDVLMVLQSLESGTLRQITLSCPPFFRNALHTGYLILDKVAGTDQWKKAREFTMTPFKMCLPFEKWAHFTQTRVQLFGGSLSTVEAILHFFTNSPNWKDAFFRYETNIFQLIKTFFTRMRWNCQAEAERFRCTSPSGQLAVTVTETSIHFQKH